VIEIRMRLASRMLCDLGVPRGWERDHPENDFEKNDQSKKW
jgi:hypothetical protein